ncbi:hypothetical protein [Loigolactobacillus bifermentans]|uniref:Uncharacterized protein n=1 Tax=Loigolactobacillus bifermentans DSM 20003 TaxID=1423726 RepID=A0A0R1HAA7_9LACO|nr:hypothetical protein [Loigolactobacillus bifermentans]KRK40897.1 hypothetical protein FC07_GL002650 [Loigolactobacillus bifermentans DSM 20003]QGG59649.1 phosphoenolpyruvate synthase [Loigolactobacillus bifermentans]
MAYTPNEWKDGDVITAAKLNALEQGVSAAKDGATGAKGDPGTDGKDGATGATGTSVTALALATDADGKVTGGTATMSDGSTVAITISTATA